MAGVTTDALWREARELDLYMHVTSAARLRSDLRNEPDGAKFLELFDWRVMEVRKAIENYQALREAGYEVPFDLITMMRKEGL